MIEGRWAREDMAADEDDVDRVDNVRWRSFEREYINGVQGWERVAVVDVAGSVATERAEETEVRRYECLGEPGEAVSVFILVGEVERSSVRVTADCELDAEGSEMTVRGASGVGFAMEWLGWPYELPRMRGWGRSGWGW